MRLALLTILIYTVSIIDFNYATHAQELEYTYLFELKAFLKTPMPMGETPLGRRTIFPVDSGVFEGPQIKGKLLTPGADWLLSLDSVTAKLDVRVILETEEKELIYMTYTGFIHNNPDGSRYFRTIPIFETSSERYSWLNHTVSVGIGNSFDGGVSYKVYAIK